MPLVGGLDHVRHEEGVHRLLGPSITPLDQLSRPQLHPFDDPQGPLIAVRPRIGDPVVPVLALNGLVHEPVGDLI
jgi:hypothetical protein